MSDEIIAALPAGRSHYDLAALVPGLNGIQFGRAGWQDVGGTNNLQIAAMSIHGGSFLDTKMAVNGLSSRNLLSSSWASNFIADTGHGGRVDDQLRRAGRRSRTAAASRST